MKYAYNLIMKLGDKLWGNTLLLLTIDFRMFLKNISSFILYELNIYNWSYHKFCRLFQILTKKGNKKYLFISKVVQTNTKNHKPFPLACLFF